mmetsp:Transcript_11840/g.33453  ORF Transcript_11840/g.33453 Transcript_11840/m.33453 type:complete len:423 (+) Transcript_11840:838-2106(+)
MAPAASRDAARTAGVRTLAGAGIEPSLPGPTAPEHLPRKNGSREAAVAGARGAKWSAATLAAAPNAVKTAASAALPAETMAAASLSGLVATAAAALVAAAREFRVRSNDSTTLRNTALASSVLNSWSMAPTASAHFRIKSGSGSVGNRSASAFSSKRNPSVADGDGCNASASKTAPSHAACRTQTVPSTNARDNGTAQPGCASLAPQSAKITMCTEAALAKASGDCAASRAASRTRGRTRLASIRAKMRRHSRAPWAEALTSSRSSTLGASSLAARHTTGIAAFSADSGITAGHPLLANARSTCSACALHCSAQRTPVPASRMRQASSADAPPKAPERRAGASEDRARKAAARTLGPLLSAFPLSTAAATSRMASAVICQCDKSSVLRHQEDAAMPTTPNAATRTPASKSRMHTANVRPISG